MNAPEITTLPRAPLPDDVIDRVAREIALEVCEHIESMYPDAAKAVAWRSTRRSIQGVVRNHMAAAGKAAEAGRIDSWLAESRLARRRYRASRKAAGIGI